MIESVTFTVVEFDWSGPFTLDEVLVTNSHASNSGLYQIYANHNVIGFNTLVYIGIAVDQTFAQRFYDHNKWLREENEVTIRLGCLKGSNEVNEIDWKLVVRESEKLAIYWHTPPYNSTNISNVPKYDTKRVPYPLLVRNSGDRGRLQAQYSNYWHLPRPKHTDEN